MNKQSQLNYDLINASKLGDLVNVKSLIEKGADIHANEDYALQVASEFGHLEVVKFLAEKGYVYN
jgi:ankyrin repeat protein